MNHNTSLLRKIHGKRILVAPLNWGLGHATRSLALIRLLKENNEVLFASDGMAYSWLCEEESGLKSFELPSYKVHYHRKFIVLGLLPLLIRGLWIIRAEKKAIRNLVKNHQIDIVLSDHRFGALGRTSKNIIVAHQLSIPFKNSTLKWAAEKLHSRLLNRFDECWIPDFELSSERLSGTLSELSLGVTKNYIGPLSHFQHEIEYEENRFDLAVVLSGPEAHRTILENKLLECLSQMPEYRICLVRGTNHFQLDLNGMKQIEHITFFDLVDSKKLSSILSSSQLIISRAGYSSIMDLAVLNKSAILIPTPGQPEQEYLGNYHQKKGTHQLLKQEDIEPIHLKALISQKLGI